MTHPPRYPRDFRGHGPQPPDARWPGGAKIAISVVLNYEEGGENCLLHGDAASEAFLSEVVGAAPWPGQRHWNMESVYDYGARAGFWRLHRLFTELDVPVTVYGVATALARAPEQLEAMQQAGWEVASHGLKWIEHKDMPEEEERAQIRAAIRLHTEVTGARPTGWYTGRCSVNTVRLAAAEGFEWISDTYDDDLPYWARIDGRDQLILPYTLDSNDMRFATAQGFNSGEQFFTYLRDAFDALYAEGGAGAARMFSIGLHCRLIGRPGRVMGLRRFLDYALSHEGVWFATRGQIAQHWRATHPPRPQIRVFEMTQADFVARFGGIYEHSPWVAERAWAYEIGPAHDCAAGVASLLARAFRSASEAKRLGVLRAHPDLAGRIEAAALTPASQAEQAGAGLDRLSAAQKAEFLRLNAAYVDRHGFPFIIAVRDHDTAGILAAFRRRLEAPTEAEFAEACAQVERIARLRLEEIFA
ncbi:allantoinase PuuE [Phaeovulum vinaykumarii]|uniref:Chitooligosaccharide deacetylase n=1 Tax=Phaeovulum vinaykumarii TaxID=407234 RepID=A0A1N7LVW8_9RHOB|nr:allantoinase PuuE [Phaeovulum vinaykumarii]SIS77995.1 chitin deacetylase [Phaeovulum vinaykumarii]SOC07208.1 chitin deacetylase [Phaeovulum vinaykumarii]